MNRKGKFLLFQIHPHAPSAVLETSFDSQASTLICTSGIQVCLQRSYHLPAPPVSDTLPRFWRVLQCIRRRPTVAASLSAEFIWCLRSFWKRLRLKAVGFWDAYCVFLENRLAFNEVIFVVPIKDIGFFVFLNLTESKDGLLIMALEQDSTELRFLRSPQSCWPCSRWRPFRGRSVVAGNYYVHFSYWCFLC